MQRTAYKNLIQRRNLGIYCQTLVTTCHMKIGIDIRLIGKNRTGDEVVIFNLVKNLAKIGDSHDFKLFTDVADEKKIGEISERLEIEQRKNFEIISLSTKNKFTWNFWTLPRYLRKKPVDVFHTQYITPFFVPKSIKITTIVHDISFNFFPHFIKFSDLLFLKILIPLSLKRADRIIAVSKFTKDEIVDFYKISQEKIEWIHNSIGEEFLSRDSSVSELERVKNKYNLPEKFILYIGTLQPRKNIPQLIAAFGQMRKDVQGFKLVICGNKQARNYDSRMDNALKDNDLESEVIFPGFIQEGDKKAIFALAQVFAFPTLYEGFGIPVLEAMSQGVPVICSDIPSLKEVAGDGAIYFDPRSLDDFSEKLYDVCVNKDLRRELILKGKERVGFFSWSKSTEKLLAIFEGLSHN